MDENKLCRCIICGSFTAKRQCFNIFTTTLERGDVLLSNFLKNVLSCSVLIIIPPDFFLCKRCYLLCSELDYSLDRCNGLQKRIQSLFKVTKANQEAIHNGTEPVIVKNEFEEDEELLNFKAYELEDNLIETAELEEEENDEGETIEDIKQFLNSDLMVNDESAVEGPVDDIEIKEEVEEYTDESSQLIEDGIFWAPTNFYETTLPSEEVSEEAVQVKSGSPVTVADVKSTNLDDGEIRLSTQIHVSTPVEEDGPPDPLGAVWFCKPCKIKFRNFESFKKHKKNITCKSVRKSFKIKSAYEYKNYTIKLKQKKKVFFCNYCTYEAPSAENMDKHILTHKSDPPLMCDICGRRFKTPSTFKRHLKVHDETRPFGCKFCTFRSATDITMKLHQRIHDDQKKFSCPKCNYKSVKKMSYQAHMRTHTGERPYCCPDCPYRAKDSSTLIRHRRTHGGLKRYHCTLCDYKALQKNSLTRHMMIHTGEKPHSCPHCDYSSTMRHNLADHIAAKHSTEKPYACNVCSYKAKAKRLLKYHMRIHTGEKPFQCSLCGMRMRHRTSLTYHMRTRHPPDGKSKVILKFVHYEGNDVEFSSDDEEEEYVIDLENMNE